MIDFLAGLVLLLIVIGVVWWALEQILGILASYLPGVIVTLIRIIMVVVAVIVVVYVLVALLNLIGVHPAFINHHM